MESQLSTLFSLDFTDPDLRASGFQEPLDLARTLIRDADRSTQIGHQLGLERFLVFLSTVQRLAYINPDDGFDSLLAGWSERQYACVLQRNRDSIEGYIGLGRSWLLKAQSSLAKIEASDSHSSSSSPRPGATNTVRATSGHEDSERLESPDYVQARDMLRASVEHFDRGLAAAQRTGSFTGELLEPAAEAYMHLGNVTSPRTSERCYQRAYHLLQKVSQLGDYEMDEHLEEFLDENSGYIGEISERWW